MVMKTYDKHTAEIHAAIGQTFAIELESVPTAGYVWDVECGVNGVDLVAREQLSSPSVGGATIEKLVFSGTAASQGELVLSLGRSWESQPKEIIRIRVTIG
jgi:predicted secreted protein